VTRAWRSPGAAPARATPVEAAGAAPGAHGGNLVPDPFGRLHANRRPPSQPPARGTLTAGVVSVMVHAVALAGLAGFGRVAALPDLPGNGNALVFELVSVVDGPVGDAMAGQSGKGEDRGETVAAGLNPAPATETGPVAAAARTPPLPSHEPVSLPAELPSADAIAPEPPHPEAARPASTGVAPAAPPTTRAAAPPPGRLPGRKPAPPAAVPAVGPSMDARPSDRGAPAIEGPAQDRMVDRAVAAAPVPHPAETGVGAMPVDETASWQGLGNALPAYPDMARRNGQEGRIVLLVRVDADGTVADLTVQSGSGVAALDRAAIQTVRGWRFRPAKVRGTAVPSEVAVPVTFRLRPDAR